ncbi:hypothetical protein EV421DRAFT_143868 [Armillaria borealis]|uniref:Uncharacterized protein n=1 Tax=Armillaria borealis TaxID=47425 RepID=A0AA39IWA6_9AGAR|nr:hypothetical protein EV421DRAFT_143868 [Armillaria borealis]
MRPGASISDITKHPGITWHHRTSPPSLNADEAASAVLSLIGLSAGTATTSSITYTNWAHLPEWIEKVLDVSWSVTYGHIGVGDGSANLLWCLKRDGLGAEIDSSESSERLKIRVHVESPANGDGILDMAASKRAVRRHLAKIINSIDFIIELVWARGDLSEYGEYSVRYAAGDTGCAIVAAGPTVIEIYDSNRTLPLEMFDSYARKLLEYTVRRDSPPLAAPVIKRGPMLSLSDDDNSRPTRIKIRPVDLYFSLWFELDKPIAAAKATVEGSAPAISCGKWKVEVGVRMVKLDFTVARVGHHVEEVHAYFADSETMFSTSQTFEIEVVYIQQTP